MEWGLQVHRRAAVLLLSLAFYKEQHSTVPLSSSSIAGLCLHPLWHQQGVPDPFTNSSPA